MSFVCWYPPTASQILLPGKDEWRQTKTQLLKVTLLPSVDRLCSLVPRALLSHHSLHDSLRGPGDVQAL